MKNLLLITAGRTDVQLVQQGKRHELDKRSCGVLLDELDKRGSALVDAPRDKDKVAITELPEGPLAVCTPKLDAVLKATGTPTAVLILETTRDLSDDPRLAGLVIEKRLRGHGVEQVQRVSYLSGRERLEDSKNPLDAVVRREVASRLDKAIREALQGLTPQDKVHLATTGGLPPANELINELVRLHAVGGPMVTALEVPDSTTGEKDDQAVPEKFHPAAGYRTRWHALDLIEKGNLLAAWGAVSHLKGASVHALVEGVSAGLANFRISRSERASDHDGQEWTKVVYWLSRFASSLPLGGCDIDVLRHKRLAVKSALRVELALRAGDIPRAVHGTVSFYEAALWDHLLERFEKKPEYLENLYPKSARDIPGPQLIRTESKEEERPFEMRVGKKDGKTYYRLHESGALLLAQDYLRSKPMKNLVEAISNKEILDGRPVCVKWLRNDVAHNEPNAPLMEQAKKTMEHFKVWSTQDTFLTQSLVQNVLKELGVAHPERLLEGLLQEVRKRLLAPSA
ncbi:MAG TPA: hypothetical protein PL002_05745 [Flavobacteriales bacterium]|nr:hypothetical protein [Flavobacteriales bacterium]HMW97283.1 hypothetical protein [Flavobacteriales bacterium]HNA32865.1 hypothetical protein [Flavobacteriales bacterium]HNK40670.1 hypothetical protein [Flavobacteriales bacterium]HNM68367.1 hypothetical protein [Flavobacteriales bacterium]